MFSDYIPLIHTLQYVAFSIAQVTNSFLIFQIITKTEKIVGSYKYLMLAFALSSLGYGWIDILALPLMHVKGPIYVVFVSSSLQDTPLLGKILACIYCSAFALVISLLSTQFVYRYIVVCKQSFLKFFEGHKILCIFVPSILSTYIWFQLAFSFACCTPEKQELLREDFQLHYGENSSTIPFSAIMFWTVNKQTKEKEWMGADLIAAGCCGCIVYGCFFIIAFCAWNLYFTLKNLTSFMSQRTLEVNQQMFNTLVAQTILPIIFVFTPSGIVLTLPLLGLYEGPLVNIVGVTVAFYPSLEPIVTIVCIKEFRKFEFWKTDNRVFQQRNSCAIT